MHVPIARRLIELNRQFYQTFGQDFSATRQRLQPGVRRVLESLAGDESILDLGCGNGNFASALADVGFGGTYLGLDFSPPLLNDAADVPRTFTVNFLQADITAPHWSDSLTSQFPVITCFATLHHIPSQKIRLGFLQQVRNLLAPGGKFILSNWQFLNSDRLRARIQPWGVIGLNESDVDADDYLLDWRAGGTGLRYVHHFSETELSALAHACHFRIVDTFESDGSNGRLGLYQIWEIV